jgi:hypothetical protein
MGAIPEVAISIGAGVAWSTSTGLTPGASGSLTAPVVGASSAGLPPLVGLGVNVTAPVGSVASSALVASAELGIGVPAPAGVTATSAPNSTISGAASVAATIAQATAFGGVTGVDGSLSAPAGRASAAGLPTGLDGSLSPAPARAGALAMEPGVTGTLSASVGRAAASSLAATVGVGAGIAATPGRAAAWALVPELIVSSYLVAPVATSHSQSFELFFEFNSQPILAPPARSHDAGLLALARQDRQLDAPIAYSASASFGPALGTGAEALPRAGITSSHGARASFPGLSVATFSQPTTTAIVGSGTSTTPGPGTTKTISGAATATSLSWSRTKTEIP